MQTSFITVTKTFLTELYKDKEFVIQFARLDSWWILGEVIPPELGVRAGGGRVLVGRQSKAGTRGKALGGKARQGTVWARQGTTGKALGGQGKARQAMHLVA